MPVVAAYGILAYRLAFHTCSEVTFNPILFFYFSVFSKVGTGGCSSKLWQAINENLHQMRNQPNHWYCLSLLDVALSYIWYSLCCSLKKFLQNLYWNKSMRNKEPRFWNFPRSSAWFELDRKIKSILSQMWPRSKYWMRAFR